MQVRLEHANIVVRDLDEMVRFVQTAFPDFAVRGGGGEMGERWLHLGSDDTYLAISEATEVEGPRWVPYQGRPGVNHLGFVVDDVEGVKRRLAAAGYRDSTIENQHPHRRRVYFNDPEGNDWEFVEYFSENPAERNDYELREVAGS